MSSPTFSPFNLAPFRSLTASKTGEVIKARAVYLLGINYLNPLDEAVYLKFYNKATAATALDVPRATIPIPAADDINPGNRILRGSDCPWYFPLGCSVRVVTGMADNDNTDPGELGILEIEYY